MSVLTPFVSIDSSSRYKFSNGKVCKYLVKSDAVWRKSYKKSGLKLVAIERSNKKHMASESPVQSLVGLPQLLEQVVERYHFGGCFCLSKVETKHSNKQPLVSNKTQDVTAIYLHINDLHHIFFKAKKLKIRQDITRDVIVKR